MPREANLYYNPAYEETAEKLTHALFGNPEKAGQVAYHRSQARLNETKADRQGIENSALTGGLSAALEAAGSDPNTIASNMGPILQSMAAAGITNPGNFTAPWWAIAGESQSGASPDEALVRAAYAGKGTAIPTDLALTPERQDEIRHDKADAITDRQLAVKRLAGTMPGKTGKGPKTADIDKVLESVLGGIPGATFVDQYQRTKVEPDVMEFLSTNGILERMRRVASDHYGTGGESARDAVMQDLALEPGARFDPEAMLEPGTDNIFARLLPGRQAPVRGPGFVTADGSVLDLSRALAAPADPVGLANAPAAADGVVRVNTPQEAMALPSGTQFMTPDGRLKVRP